MPSHTHLDWSQMHDFLPPWAMWVFSSCLKIFAHLISACWGFGPASFYLFSSNQFKLKLISQTFEMDLLPSSGSQGFSNSMAEDLRWELYKHCFVGSFPSLQPACFSLFVQRWRLNTLIHMGINHKWWNVRLPQARGGGREEQRSLEEQGPLFLSTWEAASFLFG